MLKTCKINKTYFHCSKIGRSSFWRTNINQFQFFILKEKYSSANNKNKKVSLGSGWREVGETANTKPHTLSSLAGQRLTLASRMKRPPSKLTCSIGCARSNTVVYSFYSRLQVRSGLGQVQWRVHFLTNNTHRNHQQVTSSIE